MSSNEAKESATSPTSRRGLTSFVRCLVEWCFPVIAVESAKEDLRKKSRQAWCDEAVRKEMEAWQLRLGGNREAIELVRAQYQYEIRDFARLEDKLQQQIHFISPLAAFVSAVAAVTAKSIVDHSNCLAAWVSFGCSVLAILQIWFAYDLAMDGLTARSRYQLDISDLEAVIAKRGDVAATAAAIEAVAIKLNSFKLIHLGNLLEGARLSVARGVWLLIFSVAIHVFKTM